MSPFPSSAPRTKQWHHLRLTVEDGVATVTLARPAKLNALTFGAYADLRDLLAELSRERAVRALVLGGEGRGFCSGGRTSTRSSAPRSPWTRRSSSTSTG